MYTITKYRDNKMTEKLCKFWVLHNNSLFYCGLPEGHKENEHVIKIPKTKNKD